MNDIESGEQPLFVRKKDVKTFNKNKEGQNIVKKKFPKGAELTSQVQH